MTKPNPTLELAMALIARPSITPDDAGCQRLIVERLLPLGFEAEWFYCGEVTNVLLTRGQGSPSFWFLGHTDVVPTGPANAWTSPPFEPTIRNGRLYGRGAADMKGGVAAMVVALERFVHAHPDHNGQLGLLLTSDEEGVAVDGVARVAQRMGERETWPDYCLVGEPSSHEQIGDVVRIGRRGSVNAELVIDGVQGHSAFPEKLDNPVHRLAPFLAALTAEAWDEGDAQFPPTSCQVSNIHAGTGAANVTPGQVSLRFNFRNGPISPEEQLKRRVEVLLERAGIKSYRLDWTVHARPFLSRPGRLRDAVVQVMQAQSQCSPEFNTGGGTSDARFIAPLGTEVLELGLVNQSAHKVDENVAVDDLERLGGICFDMLRKISG
jgi:succinyl-diaminopimelate desuccinylase